MRKEQQNMLFGASNYDEPSSHNLQIDWDWLDTVLEKGFARFPILERASLAEKLCCAGSYEITPDHMPVLGRHPEMPNNWTPVASVGMGSCTRPQPAC
jgi:sarcosine oxidase subunit beta